MLFLCVDPPDQPRTDARTQKASPYGPGTGRGKLVVSLRAIAVTHLNTGFHGTNTCIHKLSYHFLVSSCVILYDTVFACLLFGLSIPCH